MRLVSKYQTSEGRSPFEEWFKTLPVKEQAILDRYITRVAVGGAVRSIKPLHIGVFEIVIDHGPGYRVYFGRSGNAMVLLFGGTKSGQQRDIDRAVEYWRIFREKNHHLQRRR